ncbi:hypothetical protein HYC85_029451 [Camellia sinensis]|uniref:Uncharacterized protein n=1 Tax=Camellia sinensis TaxID=4442 RepID=A0A7J7FY08_CAMSI|nr:hypothetical protein HYC85_029451 [Camellia sinensis]
MQEDFFVVLHNMLTSRSKVSEVHCVKDAKVPLIPPELPLGASLSERARIWVHSYYSSNSCHGSALPLSQSCLKLKGAWHLALKPPTKHFQCMVAKNHALI